MSDNFTNFASSILAGGAGGLGSPLEPTDVTLYLATGTGVHFPSAFPFPLILGPTSTTPEVVKVTGRSSDVCTITRAQEGTTGQLWTIGTPILHTITAGGLADLWNAVTNPAISTLTVTGTSSLDGGEITSDGSGDMTFVQALTKVGPYNVKAYGAKGDGSTDDTSAIQAALNAANSANGGVIYFPAGTYISQTLTMYSNITLKGEGVGVTYLQLKNGTNADLMNGGSTNLSYINVTNQTGGAGNAGGLSNWAIYDMTMDGNKTNQSSGTSYVLRIYGLDFIIQNVDFRNGYSGGILLDWNGGNAQSSSLDGMESRLVNVKARRNNGIGITWGGPHDGHWTNVMNDVSQYHGFYIGPHATGLLATSCHSWGMAAGNNAVSWLIETSGQFTNCVAEGSDTVQVVLLAPNVMWDNGYIFNNTGVPATCIQFGQQAGNTPYLGSTYQSGGVTTAVSVANCMITTQAYAFAAVGTNGALWFANDNGHHFLNILTNQTATPFYTGTISNTTELHLLRSSQSTVGNPTYNIPGTLALSAASVQNPATSGTIFTFATSMLPVNPSSAITGVILQQGAFSGQLAFVENKSAYSISFAAASTSHIADEAGGTSPLAALTARAFVYDSSNGLWYRCA